MKALIISFLAAIGIVATPALANTAAVKAQQAVAHRTVAQVCQTEKLLAKAKKESWKLASQHCKAAKQNAKASVKQAKVAAKSAKAATKTATKM